jgi:putative effector of murein hydrolase
MLLQEPNLPDSGGSLSVRLTEDWFRRAVSEKSVVVGCRNGKVVGYVSGTSLAAKAHVAIIQTMLRASLLHPIAISMARFASRIPSAAKVSLARCSRHCRSTRTAVCDDVS